MDEDDNDRFRLERVNVRPLNGLIHNRTSTFDVTAGICHLDAVVNFNHPFMNAARRGQARLQGGGGGGGVGRAHPPPFLR